MRNIYSVWFPNDIKNTGCIIYPPPLEKVFPAGAAGQPSALTRLCAALCSPENLVQVDGQGAFPSSWEGSSSRCENVNLGCSEALKSQHSHLHPAASTPLRSPGVAPEANQALWCPHVGYAAPPRAEQGRSPRPPPLLSPSVSIQRRPLQGQCTGLLNPAAPHPAGR